jgi:uncharacterized membrane-anchored protein YhcB (DUF1043 family)
MRRSTAHLVGGSCLALLCGMFVGVLVARVQTNAYRSRNVY